MKTYIVSLPNEIDTLNLAAYLANICSTTAVIYLDGELGIGKTTFSRGFLHALGYSGKIKSPTYSLLEIYNFNSYTIYHFDLYRISDPEELEFIGIRDYIKSNAIFLIEWPQKGIGFLPMADLFLKLNYIDNIRKAEIIAASYKGEELLKFIQYNGTLA